MRALWLLCFFLFSHSASAALFAEFNGYFATDTFTTSTSAQYNKSFYGLDIYANLESKRRLFAGFHIDQVSLTENNGVTPITLTSQNMGLMGMWLIDKRNIWSLALGYNLVAKGTYNDGTSNRELTGTGVWGTIGAMPEIAENFYFGLKINYYSLNYTRSIVTTTTEEVAYVRTLLFPSISFAFRY